MKKYNTDKLQEAIWKAPEILLPNCAPFTRDKNDFITSKRFDGSVDPRKKSKIRLKYNPGEVIMCHYSGGSYPQHLNFWELIRFVYNTNDNGDALCQAADAYGISPDMTGMTEDEILRYKQKRQNRNLLSICARFLTSKLDTADGAAAVEYLKGRGLKPSGRFGAYSNKIKAELIDHLANSASITRTEAEQKVNDFLPCSDPDNYALVIPYYSGKGNCSSMVLRQTNNETDGQNKYCFSRYAEGITLGGYIPETIRPKKPTIIVEGYLDAEAIIQGMESEGNETDYNVVALTGSGFKGKSAEEGSQEAENSLFEALLRYRVKDVILIPDFETEKDGSHRFKFADDNIEFLTRHAKMTERKEGDYRDLKVVSLGLNHDEHKKIDSLDYITKYGFSAFRVLVEDAPSFWEYQLKDAVAYIENNDDLADKVTKIYTAISSELAKELFKEAVRKSEFARLKTCGITPSYLSRLDFKLQNETYKEQVKKKSDKLQKALNNGSSVDSIRSIVGELSKVQAKNNDPKFEDQIEAPFSEIVSLLQKPDIYLKTDWKLTDDEGRHCRNISFARGEVTTIAAPTSHGKTRFLINTALHLVEKDKRNCDSGRGTRRRYIYASIEQNLRKLSEVAIKAYIGEDLPDTSTLHDKGTNALNEIATALRPGEMPSEYTPTIKKRISEYQSDVFPWLKFLKASTDADTLSINLKDTVSKWADEGIETAAIFIDHLQLLDIRKNNPQRTEEMKDVCNILNDLAKELNIPVICASQLNRDATRNNGDGLEGVTLANIGESSSVEKISNDAYLLWQTNKIDARDKNGKLQINSGTRRTKRCYNLQVLEKISNCYYIESLKARDYEIGCFTLLEYNPSNGNIKTK